MVRGLPGVAVLLLLASATALAQQPATHVGEQVVQYFVDKYGEWILLAPRRQGFNLIVWLMPGIAVAVGLAIVGILVTRWTRRRPSAAAAAPPTDAMRERIRREMEREA